MKILYTLFFICILSCNIIEDKSDTDFTKEIAAAKKNWGKDSLRLQTMYGFKLRISKSEFDNHFDSLINVGISNKSKEIQFNGDYQSISVYPQFYNNQLMEIDFSLSDVNFYVDTNSVSNSRTESNMDEIIPKLYGVSKFYKERITYYPSDNSKIFSKEWAYGWFDNNRMIKVSRSYLPSIHTEENWRFTSAVFTDLELKEKFDLNKKIADSIRTKNEEEEKNKVFK
jgi:hypothetical protein